MQKVIDCFDGEYEFLSNFYDAPVVFDGLRYNNSEAAYQAQKCANPEDRMQFVDLRPGKAKRLSGKIEVRSDWEYVKIPVMYLVVRAKFTQNQDILKKLLATGDTPLVEGNNWNDTFWGVCSGEGQNWLGRVLMQVRREAKAGVYG